MDFAQPLWLVIGFGACLGLALLLRFMQKKRQAALEKFAAHQLLSSLTRNVSGGRRRYKNILILFSVFMCFTALARPQYGYKWVEVKRKGIDLLFALDSSKSMLAEDIKPNRLKRAHLAILDFVQQLEGDRVGLIPFAGSSYLMCPLTLDYEAFENSLSAISTNIIPHGGTNIGSVIEKASETLNNAANHKILIILTDGENLQGDAVKAAEEAAKLGLTIYTVGVGTSRGELIPLGGDTDIGFVKDIKGNFVTSRLDEKTLSTIAEKSGGLYFPLGPGGEGLENIYQQKLALIPKEDLAERRHKVPLERFEWPLAAALIFLSLELLVGERKTRKTVPFVRMIRNRVSRRNAGTALILFMALNLSTRAYGSKGEEAFERGDYLQASEYYSQKLKTSSDAPELQYNYGTAAYKNNMYDEAIEAFSKALRSSSIELQQKAYYNKGNSHYQKGAEMQQGDPESTIAQWKQALTSLQSAIELGPNDTDAKYNHEIIKKRLEELEKNQEQQEKENQQDQQQNEKQDEQKQGDSSKQDMKQQQPGEGKPQEQPNAANDSQENEQQQQPEDKGEETDTPQAINESPQDADPREQAEKDAMRQQLGKMTKEEAERMLNALKNEEGELNFVPSDRGNDSNAVDRDW